MTSTTKFTSLTWEQWRAYRDAEHLRFNPDQPRAPKGTSIGGQWVKEGDSFQPLTGRRPDSGFMVAMPRDPHGIIVNEVDWFNNGKRIIREFIDARIDMYTRDPDAFVGIWWDRKHHEVAVDVSINVQDRDAAIAKGREWDQQSIWDVVNFEEIDTGGTGGRSEDRRAAPGRLEVHDRRREGSLGGEDPRRDEAPGGLRGRGLVDPEVVEALERFYARYDPNQPRAPKGTSIGGQWVDEISAGMQAESAKLGRPKNPADGPDGSEWRNLSRETREKMKQALRDTYGITQERMVRNIIEAYETATTGEHRFGEDWYEMARATAKEIAREYGMTDRQAAAFLAALSPRTSWESNVVWGDHLAKLIGEDRIVGSLEFAVTKATMDNPKPRTMSASDWLAEDGFSISAGRRFSEYPIEEQAAIARVLGQRDGAKVKAVQISREGVPGKNIGVAPPFQDSMVNAIRIARGDGSRQAISSVLNGHKVRSFYNDIVTGGHSTSITVDAHALDAAIIGAAATRSGKKVGDVMPGVPDPGVWINTRFSRVKEGTSGPYAVFHEAFRRATVRINSERASTGLPPLTAPQVQAIAWITTLERSGT